jgi:hypothetical protein
MLRPVIYRVSEGSSGEKIINMISQKLSKMSHNLFFKSEGDVVTVVSKATPIQIEDYFTNREKIQQIKELIRMI